MKTKDFIKMLQEADPEGEGYLRMDGGIPQFATAKEGYWDGPYAYVDENGNYVYSIQGYKVDLYCMDIDDYVGQHIDIHNPNNWEEIKSKFVFELGGYCIESQRNERAEGVLKQAKEAFDMHTKIWKDLLEQSIKHALDRVEEGWRFFQDKKVDGTEKPGYYKFYHWKIIEPNNKKILGIIPTKDKIHSSNMHDTNGVLHSGLFEKLDNNEMSGYYEWKLKK